jgi:hypothetical protein
LKINGVIIRPSDKPVLHCGTCGLPFKSQIGAAECDCPPIKLRKDVLGMSLAVETFQQACAAGDEPPPSGWRDRPSLL